MMKAIIFVFLALASVVSAGDQVFPKSSCYGAPSSQANNVNLSAPVFVGAPASYLTSSHLVLNFDVDPRFSTLAFAFTTGSQGTTGTGSSCDFSINEAGVQTPTTNSWTSADLATTPTCTDAVRFTADFTSPQTALGQCFTYDNTTDGNFVFYTAVVKITTTQKRAPIRNTPITRTVTTAVQLRFRFQRFITVNASAINVVGRANVLADIITQSFDTTTEQTTIELYTSVQQPYALTLTGADASDVANVGTDSTYNYVKVSGPTLYFAGNNGVGGASTNDLTCTAAGVNILTALTSGPTGSSSPTACVQKWRIVIAETSGKCAYVGARVTYNFKLTTAPDYVGSSSGITTIAGADTFQFQYDLTTNDYCAKIVDDITLDGTLTPYGALATDPTNPGTPLYNYLFGQYVYFLAHVTASAGPSITGTNLDSATVTTISTVNTKIVPFTANSADNVFGFTKGNFLSVSQPQYAYFRFLVDENTVALDDYDVAQPVSVSAVFRVDYQNLGNAGSSAVELSNNRFTTYAAGNQGLSMQVDVGVTRPSTATGSSSLVAMVAGIAAGCVALTAFVALFLYRRSTKKFAEEMSAPVDPKELEALEGRLATTAV